MRAVFLIALAGLSGCSYGEIYAKHVSSPLLGYPVTSREDENERNREGTINELGIEIGKCYGRVCVEQSFGYDLSSDKATSLRGGPVLYTGKVSVRLFGEK